MESSQQKTEPQEMCGIKVKILSEEMQTTHYIMERTILVPDTTLATGLGILRAELGGSGTPDFFLQCFRGP